MGICSIIQLLDKSCHVVDEHDFDKSLDGPFMDIALFLDKQHPFRKLTNLITSAPMDEDLHRKVSETFSDDELEMGFLVIRPEHLSSFENYAKGDVASQWIDLFPGARSGMFGGIKYRLWGKPVEDLCKRDRLMQDEYAKLLHMVARAIDEQLYLLRKLY